MSRSQTHTHMFVRDDGETEIEVEFSYSPGTAPSGLSGPPEHYDPGEGPEVAIERAWLAKEDPPGTHEYVLLTEAERQRIEDEIAQDPQWDEDGGPDPDDWRDQRMAEAWEDR